jgi:DNA-binding CsgD family transcriptional regulator
MERSQGTPLFAGGLLRALMDEGADLARPTLQVLPEDLTERVALRLRQLDAASRNVLEMVAVVGSRVTFGELVSLCGQPLDALADLLDGLVRLRLVAEFEQGRDLTYELGHPLIQEAVYRSIGSARRRALHRHVARALIEAGRPGPGAAHFVRSADVGDPEAVDALREALAQAEARDLHREALALLAALLDLLPAGDRRWLDVYAAMAPQPEWVVDHRVDVEIGVAADAMRRIDQLLARSPDDGRRAAVKLNLAVFVGWGEGDTDTAVALAEEARRLARAAHDRRAELLAANEIGYLHWIAGDMSGFEARAVEVLEGGEATGDRFVILQGLCALAHNLQLRGDVADSVPVLDRAIAIARDDGKLYRASYLLAQSAYSLGLLGRLGEARARLVEGQAAYPDYRTTVLLDYGMQLDWLAGDLDACGAAFFDQLAWTGGHSRRRALGACVAAISAAEQDDAARARELVEAAAAVAVGRGTRPQSDQMRWAGGVSAWLRGDAPRAVEELTAAARRQREGGWAAGPFGRLITADLAEVAVRTADPATASEVDELLDELDVERSGPALAGVTTAALGAVALARGVLDEASARLEAAAGALTEAGWPLLHGRALALYGRAEAAGGRRDHAIDILRAAVERFDACRATVRRAWAIEDLRRLGARGRRASAAVTGPAALTKREREVVRLALGGGKAKEIAQQLFISERTVETHLAGAYAKLGISSRMELLRLAPDLDL